MSSAASPFKQSRKCRSFKIGDILTLLWTIEVNTSWKPNQVSYDPLNDGSPREGILKSSEISFEIWFWIKFKAWLNPGPLLTEWIDWSAEDEPVVFRGHKIFDALLYNEKYLFSNSFLASSSQPSSDKFTLNFIEVIAIFVQFSSVLN